MLSSRHEKIKIDEGLKYLNTSNFKQACVCFTEVIELNSDNPKPYAYRAECNMHLKLYELTIAGAEYSTKIDRDSSEGYLLTAKCYMIIGMKWFFQYYRYVLFIYISFP